MRKIGPIWLICLRNDIAIQLTLNNALPDTKHKEKTHHRQQSDCDKDKKQHRFVVVIMT